MFKLRRQIEVDNVEYKRKPWVTLYWRFKGLYDEEEVWMMTDAYKKDRMKQKRVEEKNNMLAPYQPTHGMTVFTKTIEEVLYELPEEELSVIHEVKSLLDGEFSEEMGEMERLYYAIEYVRYLRWLKYAIIQGEGQLRSHHVSYEKTVGKKMFQMFERLDGIRQERANREAQIIDFKVEVLPTEGAEVEKVSYDYETTAAEGEPQSRDARSNRKLDE